MKIVSDAARGIQFLHTLKEKPLVHGDIKTANILLDKSFTAKLGDFGLAREIPLNESTASYINLHSEHTPGTLGYLANEYVTTRKLSAQVDTFAFGVVLLEVYTARRAYERNNKPPLLRDYVEDIALEEGKESNEKLFSLQDPLTSKLPFDLAMKYVELSLKCCHVKRKKRPKMSETLQQLQEICHQLLSIGSTNTSNPIGENPVESLESKFTEACRVSSQSRSSSSSSSTKKRVSVNPAKESLLSKLKDGQTYTMIYQSSQQP